MLSAGHQRPLPRHAYLSDEAAERSSRTTEMGVYSLLPSECFWQKRQLYLQQHGYLLRPRYNPSWKPSWLGTNLDPSFCEDSAASLVGSHILMVDHGLGLTHVHPMRT